MARHAIDVIVRSHDGERSALHAGLERGEERRAQRALRDVHRPGISTAERQTRAEEMLEASENAVWRGEVRALETADRGAAHGQNNKRIFAERLCRPTPPRITGHIEDGIKYPMHARRP